MGSGGLEIVWQATCTDMDPPVCTTEDARIDDWPKAQQSARRPRLIEFLRIIPALGVLLLLAPGPMLAQWDKSTDWLFLCTATVEAAFGDTALCDDDVHPEGGIKWTLDETSRVLESLGFASPAISANLDLARHMSDAGAGLQALQTANHRDPRCEVRYCAWLVYGFPSLGQYSKLNSSVILNPWRTLEDGTLAPGYGDNFGYTEIHELFHAVQFGYPGVQTADREDWIDWIIEGTADHVMRALGSPMGLSPGGFTFFRTYDQALHSPPTTNHDDPAYDSWRYGSWEFFDFLGDYLGSDLGIQYLDQLFRALVPGQNNGLLAVEEAVRHESGQGLYEVFPEFVARRLIYPCHFSSLGEWGTGAVCNEGPDNEHRFELRFPDTVQRLEHTAPPMGANGYLVRMEVPEGKQGLLRIRVPRDRDASNLHLIVDEELRNTPDISGHRNEYSTVLPAGSHELLVRLANVPLDLSGADLDAGLDFTGDGPAPIEFILTELDSRVTVTHSGRAMEYVVPPDDLRLGVQNFRSDLNACAVGLQLPSEDGDLIMFGGQLSAPLSVGRYPVPAKSEVGEDDVDVVGVAVMLGCERGPCSEWGQPFSNRFSYEGWLEISQITDTHAAGEFDIAADADEPIRVVGSFLAPLGGPRALGPNHPCAPSRQATTPGSRGQGSSGHDPGGDGASGTPGTSGTPDGDGPPPEAEQPGTNGAAPGAGDGTEGERTGDDSRGREDADRAGDPAGDAALSGEDPAGGRQLNYGPQDLVDGFRRFDGSCSTFPYNLQYPESWEMRPTGGYAISKTHTDDIVFFILVQEGHGSIQAANQQVIAHGAEEVGRIDVGGQEVRVLVRDDSLVLHSPHRAGSYHTLVVHSNLGVDDTLRILDTLEPLEDC